MNTQTQIAGNAQVDSAPFFIQGKVVESADQVHRSRDLGVDFATPKLDLN